MIEAMFSIDNLIAIVRDGGAVKTGVDVYDRDGTLLLAKDIVVDQVKTLEVIRRNGLRSVPVAKGGGLFDGSGNQIKLAADGSLALPEPGDRETPDPHSDQDITQRLKEIREIREEATLRHTKAAACLKKSLAQIRKNKGQFDVQAVESQVTELVDFSLDTNHPFSYMGRELFLYDDYLYGHAVNVCAMGTAVLHRFNEAFSRSIEKALWADPAMAVSEETRSFSYYYPDDLDEMSLGFFIYDMGKALVPETLLNKKTGLTKDEQQMMQRHSYEFGSKILERNHMNNSVLSNMVQYHHGPLFSGEKNCYPHNRKFSEIPIYVRICKLMDIYDAMISKRSYKDALNQVTATTELFRTYVKKDPMLQFILHAFVSSIGLYPPGSIVFLKNGQMAYVLESRGPIVLPFTDTDLAPLSAQPDPFDVSTKNTSFQVDADRSVQTPKEVYDSLPSFIKTIAMPG